MLFTGVVCLFEWLDGYSAIVRMGFLAVVRVPLSYGAGP
jgi:hypothetical protein